ncbi:MAG: ankyrin repeat domain-containing protein [Dongiaceae bacterium]
MKAALTRFFRRILTLILLIGPFAAPAEAQTATDRMWAAINEQDATALRTAINDGADVNQPNEEGRVPLYRALVLQNQLLIDTLLSHGADPNAKDHRGDPLIFTALSIGSASGSVALIRAKADANAHDTIGMTALAFAMSLNQPDIVAALIEAGADVNASSTASDGGKPAAPIFLAIRSSNLTLAQQLIEAGANVNATDDAGSTPLHRAVLVQPAEFATSLVTTLLRAGANANAMRPKGGAPLHNLIFGAERLPPATVAQIATLLVQHGADVNLPATFDGATALDIARTKGDQQTAQLLTSMGGVCKTTC